MKYDRHVSNLGRSPNFNIPDVEIFQKIQEKYNLSPEEAERYMKTEAET